MDHAYGVKPKNTLLSPRPWRFSPVGFFSTSLIVLHFKSVIHFELIFVYGLMFRSMFTYFAYGCQLLLHYLLKRLPFLHWTAFTPLSKINWTNLCEFISGFSILFHLSVCLPSTTTILAWLLSLYSKPLHWFILLKSLFFIKIILTTLGPLPFHIKKFGGVGELHHMACGISVPRPGMNPGHSSESPGS